MRKQTLIRTFSLTMLLVLSGAWLKIVRADGAEWFLTIGLVGTLLFLAVLGREVLKSTYLKPKEKLTWLVAFVLFGWFAAVFFLLKYRLFSQA